MFGKKKKTITQYDPKIWKPVILASICTGEQTAGFKNLKTGEFRGESLIRKDSDLKAFKKLYQIEGDIEKIY